MDSSQAPAAKPERSRKRNIGKWFGRMASIMIAIVTLTGALVAWRANLAGTQAGNLDSAGLIAAKTSAESDIINSITNSEHRLAYTDYLRYRELARAVLFDPELDNTDDVSLIEQALRLGKEDMDLATTSKRYFFPGRYLNQDETYNSTRELAEARAGDEQTKDIDPAKSFTESDRLSDKVLALISMLVILAISLWCFALAETLEHVVRYPLGLGGFVFFGVGAAGAYIIDQNVMQPAAANDRMWTISWAALGLLVFICAMTIVLRWLQTRQRPQPQPAYVTTTPGLIAPPPPPPPPPGYPAATYPTPVYQQAQAPSQPPPPPATLIPPTGIVLPAEEAAIEVVEEKEEKANRFKQIVTALIATVTLFASVVAYLQTDSSSRADSADRSTQQYALDALGTRASGAAQTSYHVVGVASAWKQMDVLARTADSNNDEKLAGQYRQVRDRLAQDSPLLSKDYFDQSSYDVPPTDKFEADTYETKATELSERSSVQSDLNSQWEGKSSAYITLLTLLAVALALFGLSLATEGLVTRYIFVTVGVVIFLVTLSASYQVYSLPVTSTPDSAVVAYAKGYGLSYANDDEGAVKAFDEALAIEPKYAKALYERANSLLDLGKYDEAVQGYRAAQAAGLNDGYVTGNLGWTLYLQGKFEEAEQVDRESIKIDPGAVGVRLNLGLALLSQGRIEEANQSYDETMDYVSKAVADAKAAGKELPYSTWWFLDAGVTDLDNLLDRLDDIEHYWTQAPPKDSIKDPDTVYNAGLDTIVKLKSHTASFEYLGTPPQGEVTAEIGSFEFATKDADGNLQKSYTFPSTTKEIVALFPYNNLQKGQKILFKVYVNSYEYPEHRQTFEWDGDSEGTREQNFIYDFTNSNVYSWDQGQYIIEMYVDYHLVRRATFTIEAPAEDNSGGGR